jgi:hypothetical protein
MKKMKLLSYCVRQACLTIGSNWRDAQTLKQFAAADRGV